MRINIFTIIIMIFITIVIDGCSFSFKNIMPRSANYNKYNKEVWHNNYSPSSKSYNRHTKLVEQYRKFKGTRYCYGGDGTRCFDCSGFVNYTFKKLFHKKLARSTKEMVKEGHWVSKRDLKAGDLVFFKPGRYPRHVGIYVGGSIFIHASSSKGVTKGNLNSRYWRRHYWTARRVL